MEKRYRRTDANSKIIRNFWGISHTMYRISEGKGSQRRILGIIDEAGTITQSELTRRLDIQPGSASEFLGKMEGAGLIVRTPSEADRRTVDVRLTPEGRVRAAEAAKQRDERHAEMFACLSEEEKETLISLLETINDDWRVRYPGKGGR